jgi:multicomponent Na+:H+ antiporter subunit C
MVLTAIVITFGVSAFLLALAYRSWLLTDDDEVQDDLEDRRVLRLGRREQADARAPASDDDL